MNESDMDFRLREWLKRNWNDRMMNMVGDGVYVVNLEGTILKANSSFKSFWESLHGHWQPNVFSNQMIPEDHLVVRKCHRTIQEGSRGVRTLRRFQDIHGNRQIYDVNESPIRSGNRLWGVIGIIRERNGGAVTELSPLYYQSEERERLEHALRSSLGLIRGYAYALDRYPDLDRDKQARFIGYIREEADRLSRWLDNALETPRMEQELLTSLEEVSLVDVIRNTAHDIGEYAARRGITVEQNIPNSLPDILATREVISRIMGNLLDNAVSISPPEGKITVAAQDCDNGVAVAVTDAAYSTDHQARAQYEGIGLGLTVARRLAESLGGTIGITNNPSIGTTYTVTFPKHPTPKETALAPQPTAS
jgi:PAS domain S-box-containing protein